MLNFIGTGSAFNPTLGNNAAYFKQGKDLFLIDCGGNTFERIIKENLLKNVDNVFVLMTHTHFDHIGSLGDLILYGYYSMGALGKPSVNLIDTPLDTKMILTLCGVSENTYKTVDREDLEVDGEQVYIKSYLVSHVKELNCYGYEIGFKGELVYYSGDSNEIPEEPLKKLNVGKYDAFYQDTCSADYDGNVHLSLRKLAKMVDRRYRKDVYCMHLDKRELADDVRKLGFNVAK